MKNILLFAMLNVVLLLSASCKKQGCSDPNALNYSESATADDGSCILPEDINNIVIEEFFVSFGPGISSDSYSPNFLKEDGDMLLIEIQSDVVSGVKYWSALPYHLGVNDTYIKAEYSSSGLIWLKTLYENGTAANWTGNVVFNMRVALIKKNGIDSIPNIDKMSIDEIKDRM